MNSMEWKTQKCGDCFYCIAHPIPSFNEQNIRNCVRFPPKSCIRWVRVNIPNPAGMIMNRSRELSESMLPIVTDGKMACAEWMDGAESKWISLGTCHECVYSEEIELDYEYLKLQATMQEQGLLPKGKLVHLTCNRFPDQPYYCTTKGEREVEEDGKTIIQTNIDTQVLSSRRVTVGSEFIGCAEWKKIV